jgi:alpha-1,3-rhamnosyl/mannosyltransferase
MRRRIGVNLLWLVPGVVGGSEESTLGALDAVVGPAGAAGFEIVLFALPDLVAVHPSTTARFATVTAPVDGSNKARRVLCENTWLHSAAREHRIDLVHHGGGVVPPTSPRPCTVTIHDLQPLDLPANFSATKRNYLRTVLGLSTRRARRVAVPSEFTRSRVVERLGVDPDRVDVVPWSAPVPTAPPDDATQLVATLGVGDRFLLYPAVTYPHKNHLTLIEAFEALAADDPDIELVLPGGVAQSEEAIRARIMRSPVALRIHRVGRVPAPTLEALYRSAVAVVWPSTYEGFGLPPLEAMVRGCPVVASDIPALSEVVGDAAIVVEPTDVAAWTDAMRLVTTDATRRAELCEAGRARAAVFSPERTADSLVQLWCRALDPSSTDPASPTDPSP